MRLFDELGRALAEAGSMTWQITWSLILGFALSAVIPATRAAKITGTGITWNYTTILNIIFLLLARFVRSGSAPMLKMMGGSPAQQQHARDHSEVLPHRDAQPACQSTGHR